MKHAYAAVVFLAVLAAGTAHAEPERGLWITCIGKSGVLSSAQEIERAVRFAGDGGFKMLFVQVFRGDQAWFDSKAADASPYRKNRKAVGKDPLTLLIESAHRNGIQVHAWINTLTLSKNSDAPFLKRYGTEILTKDQHGRAALYPAGRKDGFDRYYQREDQLFLEPGDPRVRRHVVEVVRELARGYPELDGIHFDYIRYPAAPPYLPGSRFNDFGLSYGYGERNVARFAEKSRRDPRKLSFRESQIWDDWKRDQVTGLLREAAFEAKALNPRLRISAAVVAPFDRAYFAAYQEWPRWVEDGTTDFVVLMNYSADSNYVRHIVRAASGLVRDPSKLYVGLGAYLMVEEPGMLEGQIRECVSLGTGGLVLFDYDSITEAPALRALFEPVKTPEGKK